jgi:hypothetical protein
MPYLFLSFTGTLYRLKQGSLKVSDLDDGLFLFGCTREHALTPGANGEPIEDIVTDVPLLHQVLVDALVAAEASGRVRWRTLEDGWPSFGMVDDLLTANGYEPLAPNPCDYSRDSYCYPAVKRRSKQLAVIY